jgi:hypothetical protein
MCMRYEFWKIILMKFGKNLIMSVGLLEQKDLDQLKHKIQQNGVPANEIDKKSLKADGTFRIYFLKPILDIGGGG